MIFWLIILILNGVDGYSSGAPDLACSTLLPQHVGVEAQTSKAPYEIHVEVSNNKALVRISSPVGKEFQGFILQTRSSEHPSRFIDGTFTTSPLSKTVDCFHSKGTLTHTSNESKTEITTEWTPKSGLTEDVIFRATVAKTYAEFWPEIDSNPVKLSNDTELLYETCFRMEGCLGLPKGCEEQENCDILLKYSSSPKNIQFLMQTNLGPSKYMAMALSEDDKMGEDSVTECIIDETSVIGRESWNEGKSNTRTGKLLAEHSTGSNDGMAFCSWKFNLIHVANERTYDFTKKRFYILLATGDVTGGRLEYHHDRIVSPKAVNFTEYYMDAETSDPGIDNYYPPTTPKEESSSVKDEVIIITSRSSCLNICFVLLLTGLFFAIEENMNINIFK